MPVETLCGVLNVEYYNERCRRINSLTVCHKHQFERYCGTEAADVMDKLLRRALNDPVFLRYRYRPRCASHTMRTTPQRTTLTPSTAALTSERPSTVDSTSHDKPINWTFVADSTAAAVTLKADRRHVHSDKSPAERFCVQLNVLVVTSLHVLSVLLSSLSTRQHS